MSASANNKKESGANADRRDETDGGVCDRERAVRDEGGSPLKLAAPQTIANNNK